MGKGRGAKGEKKTGTGPDPLDLPGGPRTHDQGTAPAKSVVAQSATHQPRGQAASTPAHGGPTGNKPVARARQRRHPGRPLIRGAGWWVSAHNHDC